MAHVVQPNHYILDDRTQAEIGMAIATKVCTCASVELFSASVGVKVTSVTGLDRLVVALPLIMVFASMTLGKTT